MNVIRDIFSIFIILCVLCFFDSVQVESSQNDQRKWTSPVSPPPDIPHTSSYVKAQLQERESSLLVTTSTIKNEIEERREFAGKKKSKKLHNQHKELNSTDNLVTTKKEIDKRRESKRKRKSDKLRNHHKKFISTGTLNTTKTEVKEKRESTRKKKSERLRDQNNETYQISNKDGNDIAELKSHEVDPQSRKQLTDIQSRSPIYMRQQEKGDKENKENDDDEEDPEPSILNIYSLRDDMMKMLGSIPNINASVGVIGRTAEYNDIILCKISDYNGSKNKKSKKPRLRADDEKYTDEDTEKKILFIVHGLSVMGFNAVPCLNQVKQFKKLLNLYTEHLDKFDIYLIPIANPDGVSDRLTLLTNKNKSPQSACSGVAVDRNFDVSWNAVHVNSCHQQYPGPHAFSEPESRAVGDILHQFNNRIAAYINVHAGSYSADVFKGDAILYPKGFVEFNSDDDKYMDIKGEIDEALRTAGFKVMSVTVDTLYNWYGKVTGTSVDYASSVYGIPYSMEFVMQPYKDDITSDSGERTSENVLTEIWKRVFDVVFMNIQRNIQNNEVLK